MTYAGVWTIAEARDGALRQVSFELLTRGRKLADKRDTTLSSVVLASGISDETVRELIKRGADRVYVVDDPALAHFTAETFSNVLVKLIDTYAPEIIIAAATTSGRTLMPHVSMRTHAGLTADCTDLDIEEGTGNLLQTRPAIGGNILATIKTPEFRPQMSTVRPRSTKPAPVDASRTGEIVRLPFDPALRDNRVRRIGFKANEGEEVDIQSADVVVSGGKGLKKAENFALIRELAEKLGGSIGASRDAVDRAPGRNRGRLPFGHGWDALADRRRERRIGARRRVGIGASDIDVGIELADIKSRVLVREIGVLQEEELALRHVDKVIAFELFRICHVAVERLGIGDRLFEESDLFVEPLGRPVGELAVEFVLALIDREIGV